MWSQSLWNRAVSYDTILAAVGGLFVGSQSLWNRAVSYDKRSITASQIPQCLNPFGTGQCLTTKSLALMDQLAESLNPFGTGQCLTTAEKGTIP